MAHGENPPLNITPGAIRFNTDSMKLEYFRIGTEGGATSSYAGIGTLAAGEWVQITTDTPDIQTGGTRGLAMGGYPTTDTVDYWTISTTGNAIDFGNLSVGRFTGAALASRTRALYAGGETAPGAQVDTIDFFTIASTGNSSDFGNLSRGNTAQGIAGLADSTRGIIAGGYTAPARRNIIEYVTIASTGNSIDFGDLSEAKDSPAGVSSQTRGVFMMGYLAPAATDTIEFITISTLGNTADFGNLTGTRMNGGACSNPTRGVCYGGTPTNGGSILNSIEFITIPTLGNAADFGDLTQATNGIHGGAASSTRGTMAGGSTPTATNVIQYIEFANKGDAIDFGDLTRSSNYVSSCSNGHGGLG